jgi:hypothetical protein
MPVELGAADGAVLVGIELGEHLVHLRLARFRAHFVHVHHAAAHALGFVAMHVLIAGQRASTDREQRQRQHQRRFPRLMSVLLMVR